ncbi:MAG: type II toxin-antitoxin system RelE/ParE family toxin [bacterium]|nr:type II toxin-antitoxin system RelE/ParE family toxin [bacterium]
MQFELWENEKGESYVGDFIRKQTDEIALKILIRLEDLQKYEFSVLFRKQTVKKITKEIYEIRLKINGDAYRFLFVIRSNTGIILEAFKKKSSKTPKRNIKNAKNRISQLY